MDEEEGIGPLLGSYLHGECVDEIQIVMAGASVARPRTKKHFSEEDRMGALQSFVLRCEQVPPVPCRTCLKFQNENGLNEKGAGDRRKHYTSNVHQQRIACGKLFCCMKKLIFISDQASKHAPTQLSEDGENLDTLKEILTILQSKRSKNESVHVLNLTNWPEIDAAEEVRNLSQLDGARLWCQGFVETLGSIKSRVAEHAEEIVKIKTEVKLLKEVHPRLGRNARLLVINAFV
jgi:hypothetical protein